LYENFTRIPTAEQQRILEACLAEFAQHGYQQASTNAIVKSAGIPKGTLFYYFGSKKALFLYLVDYAVARFIETLPPPETLPADLFERLLARGELRMRFALQNPQLYQFFYNAFMLAPEEIQAELRSRAGQYAAASQQRLLAGLDTSRFRPGIDLQRAIDLVQLFLEGLYNRYLERIRRASPKEALRLVEMMREECQGYFEMIKEGVYLDNGSGRGTTDQEVVD
jgi:AcrR family transcriptional regulator